MAHKGLQRSGIVAAIWLAFLVSGSVQQQPNIWETIRQFGLVNTAERIRLQPPRQNEIVDFIVVGSGPSGCVLANRLSENPKWQVALLEAGGVENAVHSLPAFAVLLQGTHSNWGYRTVPQKRACFGMYNNECNQPHGRVLGGTSSINFMIYNRGNRRDFDQWAAFGNPGWSYNEVLPYFLKTERTTVRGLENSPYHNHTGPLNVEDVNYRSQMVHAYVKAAQEAGLPYTDYNGESQMGVSYVQANTLNGRRQSAYTAFIRPIMDRRKNLRILTFAHVTRVLIDPVTQSAYGVEFLHQGKTFTLRARKEVILAAGGFNSPQILMLSGVGPADNLKAIGVPLIKELPVGKLMYDHMSHFGPTFRTNTTNQAVLSSRLRLSDFVEYYTNPRPASVGVVIGGVEALTFAKIPGLQTPADLPDVEFVFVCGSLASDEGTGLRRGANIRKDIYQKVYKELEHVDHFTLIVMQFHPKSKGRVWLTTRDPLKAPTIDPNYFADKSDVEMLLQGIKLATRIGEMPALKKIGTRIVDTPVPGCEQHAFGSDDYWRCSIRTLSYTLHHQVATCRMGPESNPTTVVNHELKVHGIRKLRVADTSIIPFPITAHTAAATFMVGEKAADMIRREWERAERRN